MAGIGEYLGLMEIVGNLLAIPANQNDAAAASEQTRALLASALGPEQAGTLDALAPPMNRFPGSDVPVLGSVVRGVGEVGQVIQGVLGAPAKAPRPPLGAYTQLLNFQQSQAKGAQGKKIAEAIRTKKPAEEVGALIAETGEDISTAAKLAYPQARQNSTATNAMRYKLNQLLAANPEDPEIPILRQTIAESEAAGVNRAAATRSTINVINTDPDLQNRQALGAAKKAALQRLEEIRGVYDETIPIMKAAIPALSTNPLYAKTVQPTALWWQAATGDPDAKATQLLESRTIRLARTGDVGNLNDNERKIWEAFTRGADMTQQEFTNGLVILDKLMRTAMERHQRVIHAQSVDDLDYTPPPMGIEATPGGDGPTPDEVEAAKRRLGIQ